jgi:uncharacterized protein (TIGR00251 family)
MALKIEQRAGGVSVAVKVVPGASRDRIVGELGDALKLAVSKPPQGGAANAAVVGLVSHTLGLPRQNVTIVRGHSTPRKELLIVGLTVEQVCQRLLRS